MPAISDLLVRIGLDNKRFKAGMKESSKDLTDLANAAGIGGAGIGALSKIMEGAAVMGGVMMAKQIAGTTYELGKTGAKALQTAAAFDQMVRTAGGSGESIVAAIRKATSETVTSGDIMASVNRGILLGLGANAEQWEKLAEVARFRARAMGVDMTQALDDIVTGIGRESRLILDNLGIIIDTDQVTARYAATLGKTAEQLSFTERKQALLTAVIDDGQKQIAAAGGIVDNYVDQFARLEADVASARTELAKKWAPVEIKVLVTAQKAAGTWDQMWGMIKAWAMESAAQLQGLSESQAQVVYEYEMLRQAGLSDSEAAAQAAANYEAREKAARGVAESLGLVGFAVNQATAAMERERGATSASILALLGFKGAAAEVRVEMNRGTVAGDDLAAALRAVDQAAYFKNLIAAQAKLEGLYRGLAGGKAAADQFRDRMYGGDLLAAKGEAAVNIALLNEEHRQSNLKLAQDTAMANEMAAQQSARAWQDSYNEAERAAQDFRSLIQQALQPTDVTAFDFDQAAAGTYLDKWDENARRAEAIAQGGFDELKKHADWAGILKIPPEVLAGSEQALKDWAARTADAVRGLERPDLLNVDAALAAIQEEINRQAAVELSLDIITKAAMEQGLVQGEDAKSQVAKALGLETPLPVSLTISDAAKKDFTDNLGSLAVPVGLEAPAKAETDASMIGVVDTMREGFAAQAATVGWAGIMITTMTGQIKDSKGQLLEVGGLIGAPIWDGLLDRLRGSGIVNHIIAEVLAALAAGVED